MAKNKSERRVKGIISRKYIGVQRLVSKLGLVEALHGHLTEIFRRFLGLEKGGITGGMKLEASQHDANGLRNSRGVIEIHSSAKKEIFISPK